MKENLPTEFTRLYTELEDLLEEAQGLEPRHCSTVLPIADKALAYTHNLLGTLDLSINNDWEEFKASIVYVESVRQYLIEASDPRKCADILEGLVDYLLAVKKILTGESLSRVSISKRGGQNGVNK